jgi:hypothetical protein
MPLIDIYDAEMIGDTRDPLKKQFKYLSIQNATMETTTDADTSGQQWRITSYEELPTPIPQTTKVILNLVPPGPTIQGPPSDTRTLEEFLNTTLDIDTDFLYHFTSVDVPAFDEDYLSFNNALADNYSFYNYKLPQYEESSLNLNEKQLPNFMLGVYRENANSFLNSMQDTANYYYNYYGEVDFQDFQMLSRQAYYSSNGNINFFGFDDQTVDYSFNSSSSDSNYFYKFSQLPSVPNSSYATANNNVFINFDYNESECKKNLSAPYYVKIRIPKTADSYLNQSGPNSNISTNIIADSHKNKALSNVLISSFKEAPQTLRNFIISSETSLQNRSVKIYDLPDYLASFDGAQVFNQENTVYLREGSQYFIPENEVLYNSFIYQMVSNLDEIEQKISDNIATLSFKDIIDGNEKCYSEVLGYKIQKFGNGPNPIQTFYIMNKDSSIVDTQLKIEKSYTYVVSAMVAIGGIRYSYSDLDVPDPVPTYPEIKFLFVKQPSIKVAEIELSNFTTKIVEPPPLAPEVSFDIEKNTKNMLKIFIENSKGNQIDKLIEQQKIDLINASDAQYEADLQKMHGGLNYPFSSRAFSGGFEIFRLEEVPSEVSDFSDNSLALLTTQAAENGKNYDSVAYTDYIRHNTDYYYLIRARTHRGNPGISSVVYKIRLLEDADEIIMKLTTVNIQKQELFTFENKMRKYLQIIPNKSQAIIDSSNLNYSLDPDNQNNLNNLKLSNPVNVDSLWDYDGKTKFFKIRLESDKTGKKIDLNVSFKFSKPT